MTRKAILIESSNVKGQKDLPGARVDIANWTSFLKSDLGGAWSDAEIRILRKPYSSDVDAELSVAVDSYCFVAFSGHGSDGSVVLNDILGTYSIAALKPKTKQGTLIVDSCRGIGEARALEFRAELVALANTSRGLSVACNSVLGRSTDFELSEAVRYKTAVAKLSPRVLWDTALRKRDNGVVEMLACAKGQSAGEEPTAGGFYTSLLLESAEQWRVTADLGAIHSTKDAHDFAKRKLPVQQTPEYSPVWLAFPFAIKVEG